MINDKVYDEGGAVFNVRSTEFGAQGTGLVDDSTAINNALDAARKASQWPDGTSGGAVVYFPPGLYRIDTPLNCTAGQYNLRGSGAYQTVLLGNTGNEPVIDMSGASYSSVRDLMIDSIDTIANVSPLPNPSTLGILCSRILGPRTAPPPNPEPQAAASLAQANLSDVNIRLVSSLTPGNPNSGSVAVYNFGVEEVNYHNVQLRADTPLVICDTNVFGFASPYMWLPTLAQSMTAVNVTGQSSLVSWGLNALRLHGGAAATVDAFLSYEVPPKPSPTPDPSPGQYAIYCSAMWTDLRWRGDMEGFATLLRLDDACAAPGQMVSMIGVDVQGYASYTAGEAMVSLSGLTELQGGILRVTPTPTTASMGWLLQADGTESQYVQNLLMYAFNTSGVSCPGAATQFQGNVVISSLSLSATAANVAVAGPNTGNVLMGYDMTSVNGIALAGVGSAPPDAAAAGAGAMYYDTSLSQPVWSNGSAWKNAAGE